jgi:hypothetical protein
MVCCMQTTDLSFQDFYTIILEVAARYRDDVLAQPPDQDYNRDRWQTAYRQSRYACIYGGSVNEKPSHQ